jgi:hypothetical protein
VSVPPSCVLARCSHPKYRLPVAAASGDTLNRDNYDAACTHTAADHTTRRTAFILFCLIFSSTSRQTGSFEVISFSDDDESDE